MNSGDETAFPLVDWFDLEARITREMEEECRDQMALYAYKDALTRSCPSVGK